MTQEKAAKPKRLTPKMWAFVGAFNGDQMAAAKTAGFKYPKQAGYRLMQNPAVQEAVKAKQNAMVQSMGKRIADEITISPVEVVNILAEIARSTDKNARGEPVNRGPKAAAAKTLAEIFGLRAKDDDDEFLKYLTQAELLAYASTGKLPERFRLFADESQESLPTA